MGILGGIRVIIDRPTYEKLKPAIVHEFSDIKIVYLKMPCPSRDGRISDSNIFEL